MAVFAVGRRRCRVPFLAEQLVAARALRNAWCSGGNTAMLAEELIPLVYDRLRKLAGTMMRREPRGHMLQGTPLVHEAILRLFQAIQVDWQGKTHLFCVATLVMRQILVDHARRKKTIKHGGGKKIELIAEDLIPVEDLTFDRLALNELLEELANLDPRQCEIVRLKVWGGHSDAEIAEVLGVSKRTVYGDWTHAKAWLKSKLKPSN
jgi:RNA polymerase sigma factor (TIGR02999 family)